MHMSRIEWIVAVSVYLLVAGAGLYVFERSRNSQAEVTCQSSMGMLADAIFKYAKDHDHHLPSARNWWSDIYPKYCHEDDPCPKAQRSSGVAYAMSAELSGVDVRTIEHPDRVILLYEACNGVPEYRHRGGMNVAYADGHRAWIPRPKQEDFR